MSSEDLQKIKQRIVKLLAMAADASSPEEAAIAARRARLLMDKHQLAEFDLQGRIAEAFAEKAATRFFAAMPIYLQFLASRIGQYNDCQAVLKAGAVDFKKKPGYETTVGRAVVFKGYESDVDLAVQMYHRLTEAVDRMCKEFLLDKGYTKYPVRIGSQFKLGAIMTIGNRISEMLKDREQIAMDGFAPGDFDVSEFADDTDPSTSSRALVLMDVKKASVEEHFGKLGAGRTVRVKGGRDDAEYEARTNGYAAGARVEITPSIGAARSLR